MKKRLCVAAVFLLCGCSGERLFLPVAPPALVPGGVLLGVPVLDGQWAIADDEGGLFCITIQEGRISIVNNGCLTNGRGFAVRILEAPEAAIAGPHLVISASYNPRLYVDDVDEFTFVGELQPDGTYVGRVTVETMRTKVVGPDEYVIETQVEHGAILARS